MLCVRCFVSVSVYITLGFFLSYFIRFGFRELVFIQDVMFFFPTGEGESYCKSPLRYMSKNGWSAHDFYDPLYIFLRL